jgi:hypothetical protein
MARGYLGPPDTSAGVVIYGRDRNALCVDPAVVSGVLFTD